MSSVELCPRTTLGLVARSVVVGAVPLLVAVPAAARAGLQEWRPHLNTAALLLWPVLMAAACRSTRTESWY